MASRQSMAVMMRAQATEKILPRARTAYPSGRQAATQTSLLPRPNEEPAAPSEEIGSHATSFGRMRSSLACPPNCSHTEQWRATSCSAAPTSSPARGGVRECSCALAGSMHLAHRRLGEPRELPSQPGEEAATRAMAASGPVPQAVAAGRAIFSLQFLLLSSPPAKFHFSAVDLPPMQLYCSGLHDHRLCLVVHAALVALLDIHSSPELRCSCSFSA
jgi:hypothetical protein